jgi:benzoyl-CoA reductase/2-hydroxyglutaryl-CoA dehydratase subunit BcrC/BadD/HgdB
MVNKKNLEDRIIPYRMLYESVISTLELVDRILPKDGIPSLRVGLENVANAMERNIEKVREGSPIVGYHFAIPAEILYAFDCVPICIEAVSYMLAALLYEGVEKYYDIIANWGHPFHTCTSQKGVMGMALDDLIDFDAIFCPTAPCDNTCASYPFFKYEKNIPLVIADLPYLHEEKSYKYFANQLEQSIFQLGNILEQEPDFKKLKKHISIENKVNEIKLEIFDLIMAKPSPIENMYNAMSAAANIFLSGTEENINFYNKMLELAEYRYKNHLHHGGEERIRSIWPYMITFFDISLCEWLDRKLGLSILFDIFNYNFSESINISSNLDTIFYEMAKKCFNFPMTRQSTQFLYPFIEDCVEMAKNFKADCFIYTSSIACKQFGAAPKILKEALMEEVGIPTLPIELDVGDARVTSLKTIKNKIEMFAQTLL